MTFTDWILDIALVLMVLRQIRETRMDRRFWLLPVIIVAIVAHSYLEAVPTAGNDLLIVGGLAGLGAVLGVAGGLTTRVRAGNGAAFVRAGWTAASLWVGSMTARLLFVVWISHSGGEAALARFSAAHHITSGAAWQDGLVLMALAEVILRIGIILVRGHRAAEASRTPAKVLAAA